MKKALVVAVAMALILSMGVIAMADYVRIGDLVLHSYHNLWERFNVPQVSFSRAACQLVNRPVNIEISGLRYGQVTWLYGLIEGNQLISFKKITHNGLNCIVLPSLYNNGNWKEGWQTLTIVLAPFHLFNIGNEHRPQSITAENFVGYPCSGYVVLKQISFYVPGSYCSPCCLPCLYNPCCP